MESTINKSVLLRPIVAAGLMSGTSMDGIDIVACAFSKSSAGWKYEVLASDFIPYNAYWKNKLQSANSLTGFELIHLHKNYGVFCGQHLDRFQLNHHLKIEVAGSHGHTIFHNPDKLVSFQLGDGAAIYALSNIPTVSDFRAVDVCLAGEGAPLVPIGDELLFSEYDFCLNLGGIANVSLNNKENKRIAWDIAGCNLLLNTIVAELGLSYDEGGKIAATGTVNPELVNKLNQQEYYKLAAPKSLDKDRMLADFLPVIALFPISTPDKLACVSNHIAEQISLSIQPFIKSSNQKILITGGGAWNDFLIQEIKKNLAIQVIVPDEKTINFKEAIIFAFLAVLRVLNIENSLKTVTGANKDSLGGSLFGFMDNKN